MSPTLVRYVAFSGSYTLDLTESARIGVDDYTSHTN